MTENTEDLLKKINIAKELRYVAKKKIASNKCSSLSLCLNIPGHPKSSEILSIFFDDTLKKLKRFLLANRVFIDTQKETKKEDEAGRFYLVPITNNTLDIRAIKNLCEEFESSHMIGRCIDVDITDTNFQPISSNKKKSCFICKDKAAIICMREKSHSYNELRETIFKNIHQYLSKEKKELILKELSSYAIRSILHEISLTPKPGLVDTINSGAHTDMDYLSFLDSTAAISGYFYDMAKKGYEFKNNDYSKALPLIRYIGIEMESRMFRATNGINTQKGVIFLLGISIFTTAHLLANNNTFSLDTFVTLIKDINKDLTTAELSKTLSNEKTHGEECYKKYGKHGGGARIEAEQGFPTVINHGLPQLEKELDGCSINTTMKLNEALTNTLLAIIAKNNDSNILYRTDDNMLSRVKEIASDILLTEDHSEKKKKYNQFIQFCLQNNISPGGSADLLSVCLFVYYVNNRIIQADFGSINMLSFV